MPIAGTKWAHEIVLERFEMLYTRLLNSIFICYHDRFEG